MFSRILLLIALLVPVSAVASNPRITIGGYVFCASLEEFREQSRLSRDRAAWNQYMQYSSCNILAGGTSVYVESARGLGVIRIRPTGSTVWFYTNSEAVR
jgi:hypothetical protein